MKRATKPARYGVEGITQAQAARWEAAHGEFWADVIEPETRTGVRDFATSREAYAFLEGPVLSGHYARIFERVNLRQDLDGIWEWDEREMEMS